MSPSQDLKLLIAGLDYVGKSSIVRKIFAGFEPEDVENLRPTRNFENLFITLGETKRLGIWDLGGQLHYRKSHLERPALLSGTTLLIFIVDVQDPDRYDLSFDYFEALVRVLLKMDLNIDIAIFMHKFDPKIQDELKSELFKIRNKFNYISKIYKGKLSYYSTSIFSETLEFSFSRILKQLEVPLDIYEEGEITTNIYLKDRKTKVEDSINQEMKIDELDQDPDKEEVISALTFLKNLAGLDDIELYDGSEVISIFVQFHKDVIGLFENTIGQYSGDELKFVQMDLLMRATVGYCTRMIGYGTSNNLINADQAEIFALIFGQINFMKIHFLNILEIIDVKQISSRIKFLELSKEIIGEMPLLAYLINGITREQYILINPMFQSETRDFNLLPAELSKKVYSFDSIDELQNLISKEILDLTKLDEMIGYSISQTKELLEATIGDSEEEFIITRRLIDRFDHLTLEFYYLIKNLDKTEYAINQFLISHFESIIQKLIKFAQYIEIFTVDEKNRLYVELSNL